MGFFDLGCTVGVGHKRYSFDVVVGVEPELRILRERLRGPAPTVETGAVEYRDLLRTVGADRHRTGIRAEVFNGKRGANPSLRFRDTRLLTSQLLGRMAPDNRATRAVLNGAAAVTAALRGVFHLDPVPHLMRDYVPERDADLRRTGENLSAAIARLMEENTHAFARFQEIVCGVAGEPIQAVEFTRSSLGDVMLALREGKGSHELTPAREMSDGLLRFMAVAAALLSAARGLDLDPGVTAIPTDLAAGILLVIEELESGLHPSQAIKVLDLIRETTAGTTTRVALTTHSPALLNAVIGTLNESVYVCYRDSASSASKIARLTELPGYAEAMASGRIGDSVAAGQLTAPAESEADFGEFHRILVGQPQNCCRSTPHCRHRDRLLTLRSTGTPPGVERQPPTRRSRPS